MLGITFSLPLALLASLVLLIGTVCYRRFFHPLRKIPGPFLPSVTRLYLWYHNVVKDGTYYLRIDEMHEKYGPVIRVAPNEVHLNDPDNYDKIYCQTSQFTKDDNFYNALGIDVMFTAVSNDYHQRLRAPLNQFFSRRVVFSLEDIVQDKVKKLCRRMQSAFDAGQSVDLRAGSRAISIDVITEYAFNDCWDHLEQDDFAAWFSVAAYDTGIMWWYFQQWPILKPIQKLPESWARKISPAMNGFMECVSRSRNFVIKVHEQVMAGVKPQRRTIFHELLDPEIAEKGKAAGPRPSMDRLYGEALSLCNAAADTTGNSMEMSAYYVLTNPNVYKRLTEELRTAFPDPNADLPCIDLEKLPYLTGVLKEGQRLSYGVISGLARGTPKGGVTFNGHFIPAGTTISMSAWTMHRNPAVFPSPDTFDPMRWIDPDPAVIRAREKCLVPFSRGARACLGQNLAMSELYVFLGTFFRRFDKLEIFDCGPKDMTYVDYFAAFHPRGSRPLRVVMKEG